MSDPTLAIPGTVSFWFLFVVFVLHRRFTKNGDDLGSMARLQFYACVSGFISALGSCISTYDVFYSVTLTPIYDTSTNTTTIDVTASPRFWCGIEAVTNSFGELSLVLWIMANSVYFLITLRLGTIPHTATSNDRRTGNHDHDDALAALATPRWLFPLFQVCVWSVTSVMTFVPAIRHLYGPRYYDGESWCWFKDGHQHWEWAQFYGPLSIANLISIITFSYSLITLGSFNESQHVVADDDEAIEAAGLIPDGYGHGKPVAAGEYVRPPSSVPSSPLRSGATGISPSPAMPSSVPSSPYHQQRHISSSSAASAASVASRTYSSDSHIMSDEELAALELQHRQSIRRLFMRLAWQNGVLFVVFVPDAIVYYIETYSDHEAPWALERLALFLWKCEGFCVALLWLSNSQVQLRLNQIPSYVWFMNRYIRIWYGRLCCICCKRRDRPSLASQITMARPAYSTTTMGGPHVTATVATTPSSHPSSNTQSPPSLSPAVTPPMTSVPSSSALLITIPSSPLHTNHTNGGSNVHGNRVVLV